MTAAKYFESLSNNQPDSHFNKLVFFSFAGTKGSGGQERRLVSQLTELLDGLHSRGNLVVVGATNRPQALDASLRRPGRLEKEVRVLRSVVAF